MILVSNEVGLGVVPDTALGRAFRDLTGRAHRLAVRAADQVYRAALGMVLRLKPAPLDTMEAHP